MRKKYLGLLAILIFLFFIYKNTNFLFTPKLNEMQVVKELPASPSATFRVPVLLYHYVEYVKDEGDTVRKSLNITPYIFENQVKTLSDAGFTFMTVSEIADVLDGKKHLPQNPVALTFDDGYWDLYTDVLPILRKYNVKATAYIVPGFIGGSNSLNAAQLQEVARSGLVEIGAHTVHHYYLKGLSLAVVESEVKQSKEILERDLKMPISSFAYPYGVFDKQTIDVVKNAGFRISVSTIPGVELSQGDRYFVSRLRPGMRTGADLLKYLQQNTFNAY